MAPCKVLLVAPKFHRDSFWNCQATCKVMGARYPAAPLGLLTVAALLPAQWDCRLIDRNIKEVSDPDLDWADLVMTGGMITQRLDCLDFITRAQARGKCVVVGGPDASGSPKVYAQSDFVVVGEAEDIIKDFIDAWRSGADVASLPPRSSRWILPRRQCHATISSNAGTTSATASNFGAAARYLRVLRHY